MLCAANLTWPLPQKLQQLAYPCSGIAPSLAIKVAGFADPVIQAGAERYQQIFFAGGAAVPPPTSSANTISVVSVTVTTNDTALRFGIDESYSLVVNGSVAAVTAATPFGALWALETLSQLISRVYTTSASGAVNSTYYQVCPVSVTDAPRFPYRGASRYEKAAAERSENALAHSARLVAFPLCKPPIAHALTNKLSVTSACTLLAISRVLLQAC